MGAYKVDLEDLKTKKLVAALLSISKAQAEMHTLTIAFGEWLQARAKMYPPAVEKQLSILIDSWGSIDMEKNAELAKHADSPHRLSRAELIKTLHLLQKSGDRQADQDDTFRVEIARFASNLPADEATALIDGTNLWSTKVNGVMGAMNAEIRRIAGLPPAASPKATMH